MVRIMAAAGRTITFVYRAEVIEHPPISGGNDVHLACANTMIYKSSKLCIAIIFPFYHISFSNFAVILILTRCFQLWRWIFCFVAYIELNLSIR